MLSPAVTEHQGVLGAKGWVVNAKLLGLTGNRDKISGGVDVGIATSLGL